MSDRRSRRCRRSCASIALLLTTTFAACQSDGFTAQERALAPADATVLAPATRPEPKIGEDLGLIADAFQEYGDENAYRLVLSRCNAEDQVVTFATGGKERLSKREVCVRLRSEQAAYAARHQKPGAPR